MAERCLEMTVAYVKERRQFARPVGSFQAIKHRLADLWVAVVQARAVARYAATCLAAGGPDTPVAVALAKATCSDVALKAAQETHPAARRDRLHLGAPGAPVPQAGQGRLDRLRHRRRAPGLAGRAGRPAARRRLTPRSPVPAQLSRPTLIPAEAGTCRR